MFGMKTSSVHPHGSILLIPITAILVPLIEHRGRLGIALFDFVHLEQHGAMGNLESAWY